MKSRQMPNTFEEEEQMKAIIFAELACIVGLLIKVFTIELSGRAMDRIMRNHNIKPSDSEMKSAVIEEFYNFFK